jgi:hypothetical protein
VIGIPNHFTARAHRQKKVAASPRPSGGKYTYLGNFLALRQRGSHPVPRSRTGTPLAGRPPLRLYGVSSELNGCRTASPTSPSMTWAGLRDGGNIPPLLSAHGTGGVEVGNGTDTLTRDAPSSRLPEGKTAAGPRGRPATLPLAGARELPPQSWRRPSEATWLALPIVDPPLVSQPHFLRLLPLLLLLLGPSFLPSRDEWRGAGGHGSRRCARCPEVFGVWERRCLSASEAMTTIALSATPALPNQQDPPGTALYYCRGKCQRAGAVPDPTRPSRCREGIITPHRRSTSTLGML